MNTSMAHPSLGDVNLNWTAIREIAAWCEWQPRSVYNVATGRKPWQQTSTPAVVRHLYALGWRPTEGRRYVRLWLNARALRAQRDALALACA